MAQVTEEAIDDLIENNSIVVIYISDKKDESLAEIEEEIKEMLIEDHLQQYFHYLDISEEAENDLERVLSKYSINVVEHHLPIFVVFSDNKFADVFNDEVINIDKLRMFFIQTGVIESE